MAKSPHDQFAGTDDERQYQIDQITARYEDEYHAGKSPRIADYVQRYPQFARELTEFALFFHTIGADQPEPEPAPARQLSPAAQAALARIHPPPPIFKGFVQAGLASGYTPPKLAEALGIGRDVLAKLEAHAIAAGSIPHAFIQRAAERLSATPEAIRAYLRGASPAQAGAFFYSDQAPKQEQETFLEAIQASPQLTATQKHEWGEQIKQEGQGT